jgi:hypothetical protein
MRLHVLAASVVFMAAFAVRWWLRQGLVLGDDPQEYALLLHVLMNGPMFTDQLHLRWAGWILNHLAFWLFGVSEPAPTALATSSFGVFAYALFVRWRYGRWRAFLGGLLVAVAPFEVMLGSLRANDSYLELAMGMGFTALVLFEAHPIWQGIALALALWLGFTCHHLRVAALGLISWVVAGGRSRRSSSRTSRSTAPPASTKAKVGMFFPFISMHGQLPVPLADLPDSLPRFRT